MILEHNFMDVYCSIHPMSLLRKRLSEKGAVSASCLSRMPSGSLILIAGLVIFFHTPPTRSGKRIIFATLEDETGLFDVTVTPFVQNRWGKIIYTSEILALEGRLLRQGKDGTSVSIKATRIIPTLCGQVEDLSDALKC